MADSTESSSRGRSDDLKSVMGRQPLNNLRPNGGVRVMTKFGPRTEPGEGESGVEVFGNEEPDVRATGLRG